MKRPKSVTLLALGVLSFTGIYLVRFVQTIVQWNLLISLPLRIPPAYLGITGAIWGAVGLVLTWGLWKGRPWAPKAVLLAGLAFAGFLAFDRLFLASKLIGLANWPFSLILVATILVLIYWLLSRPYIKSFFGEVHD